MNKYKWKAHSSRVSINKDKWDDISKMASRIFSPLNKFGDSCIKIFQFPVQLFFIISNVVQSQYLYLLVSGINGDYGRVNHWSIVLKISLPLDRHKGPPSPPPQPPSTPASALAFSLQSFPRNHFSTAAPQPPAGLPHIQRRSSTSSSPHHPSSSPQCPSGPTAVAHRP